MSHHHGHGHGHGHHHHHALENIKVALILNAAFSVIEIVGGIMTGSVAIVADAIHDIGDTLAIGSAYFMERLSEKGADERYSYGMRRLSVLSALITSTVVLVGSIVVLGFSIPRLFEPTMPVVEGMIGLALLGVVVNGYGAFRVQKGSSLNEQAISWHLIEDVLGWVIVLLCSIVMYFIELPILDPILSIGFSIFIMWNVIKTFRATIRVFLQATPEGIDFESTLATIRSWPQVQDINHVHLWSLDGERHVVTLNAVIAPDISLAEALKTQQLIKAELAQTGSFHCTIELTTGPKPDCGL